MGPIFIIVFITIFVKLTSPFDITHKIWPSVIKSLCWNEKHIVQRIAFSVMNLLQKQTIVIFIICVSPMEITN